MTDTSINNIGVQGAANFGIGITNTLPVGMSEMTGTTIQGHQNYGNYQYSDGSIMCWIPQFYYRWGGSDSPRADKHGLNSCDVKSKYDFVDIEAANAAGYALHRAFYDDGKIQSGFFIDKYQASNNAGIASSIKNSIPLSSASKNNPFSDLNGTPANNSAGAIDAVKTRGAEFFVTTLFVQRALSLLSMAQAQAATSTDNCAWYDAKDVTNYPKGCSSNTLQDDKDQSVKYEAAGYLKAGKTGSALLFAKTTHNGQANGVADLKGNLGEICLGITQLSGKFYALKPSVKVSLLTSGNTLVSDAWGKKGVSTNYDTLGTSVGELTGGRRVTRIGSTTNQVFSSAVSGGEWQAACAGIPLVSGASSAGQLLFGNDELSDGRYDDMCPLSGGYWGGGVGAGVWSTEFNYDRLVSAPEAGVRAALYNA